MNVWLKSLKSNKYKQRFSSSTVSALNKSQLEIIPQTEQHSSQDNTLPQSFEQGKKKENVFKGNVVTSTPSSDFKQVVQDKKLYPRSDHFQKKKVSLNLEPRAINQPSSYNSELMKFQRKRSSSNNSDSENSESNYSNERSKYNFSYKERRSSNGFSKEREQKFFTTSSISHEIGKITKEGKFISSLKKRSTEEQYIQRDPVPVNTEFLNNFKQNNSRHNRITDFKADEAIQKKNEQKKLDFGYENKKQITKARETKLFLTQKNFKNQDYYFSTQQDKNQDSKKILQVKKKRRNFISSLNQESSLSRQNSSSSRDQYLNTGRSREQYLNTGRSRQSTISYLTGTQKSSKQANINSKSMRPPTTGKNIQHLKQYRISIIEYCSKQVGLACYNDVTGEIVLSQIIQNMTYFKTISTIQRYYPIQIIYSQTTEKTLLMKKLMQKFKITIFRPVNRKDFDQTKGFYLYKQISNKSQYNPNNNFIAYASFNALILYLEKIFQSKLKYQILSIKWHRLQQVLAIQSQTITDLQIFTNFQTKKIKNSFIQNFKCRTYGGTRMLRANILQPSSCQKVIFERQQLTQKLLQNQNIFNMLEKQIIKFRLYQPVTTKFIQNPRQQHLKSLKVFLSSILLLSHQCFELKNFQNKLVNSQAINLPIICELKKKLQSKKLQELRDIIKQNFNEQILQNYEEVKNKKDRFIFLFKVQKIQDEFAQVRRITYSQTITSILQIFESIKAKSKQDLKLLYNDARGYYISAKREIDLESLSEKLKEDIIHISKRGRAITFSTQILASLNNRLKESEKILIFQSESALRKVICQIQQNIDILFQINHYLSTVDMIMSFTGFILKNNHTKFVKPTFCRGNNTFSVINLNPVWFDQNKGKESSQDNKLELITFQNSLDKTIFCFQKQQNSFQQQAIIFSMGYTVILSQIGCFVPAESVRLELFDCLISKIKLHQTIQMNLSRFQLAMSHFNNIFQNCTTKSERCLILIDQLARGTQHSQQCALSMAFVQQFQKNRGTTIILSSDRMLLSLLTQFRKVHVELSKRGINCKERYQQMDKWILETLQKFNFDNDFINFYKQLNVQDQMFQQFEEIKDLINTKKQDQGVFKNKKNQNKMHRIFAPQNFVNFEQNSSSQSQVDSSQK